MENRLPQLGQPAEEQPLENQMPYVPPDASIFEVDMKKIRKETKLTAEEAAEIMQAILNDDGTDTLPPGFPSTIDDMTDEQIIRPIPHPDEYKP